MARYRWMRDRVENWAAWAVRRGDGAGRYAAMRYEAPAPQATEPYADAPIRPNDEDAWQIDGALRAVVMPVSELRATVECYYLSRYTQAEKLRRLAIAKSTLHTRLDRVDQLLVRYFGDRQAQAAAERARVEKLRESVRP